MKDWFLSSCAPDTRRFSIHRIDLLKQSGIPVFDPKLPGLLQPSEGLSDLAGSPVPGALLLLAGAQELGQVLAGRLLGGV